MNDRKEHHLFQLFVKLGHELEQIRQRALSNLIAKLDNDLISSEELANEKYLHVRLLEWFNFPSWPLAKEVLMLIKRLIQYQIALESFVELNAIQFLMHLRVHLDEDTQSLLDEILNSLKCVPNIQSCYQRGCIFFSKSERRELSDEISTSQDEATFTFDSYVSRKQSRYQNTSFSSNNVECSHCFNNSHFPWVSLTADDKFVLDSSVEWLSSADADSCNMFVADVLFHDFPAEVFLQRPQIIKVLIGMVSSSPSNEGETKMLLGSISTLSSFCQVLSSRIQFHADLDFSTGTERMDRDDDLVFERVPDRGPIRTGDDADRLDFSFGQRLQEERWSVQEFCLNLMERVIPLLSGLDMMIFSKCLRLTSAALKLLRRSVDKHNLWQHHDHQDFKRRILLILKQFSTIMVSQHRTKSSRSAACEVTRRQMFFVGLSGTFLQLIENLVDLKETPLHFQQDCFSCFEMMQQDVFLELSFPGLCERIESLLSTTNCVPSYSLIRSNEVMTSLRCCCRFLNASLKDEKESGDSRELINMAEQGLLSFHEHRSIDFIECSIKLITSVCCEGGSSSSDVERCLEMLLRLLACSDVVLQAEVYEVLRRLIKGTLNIEKFVVKSDASDLNILDCLLDARIFYEIIAFGFSSLEMQIQETSKDVLLHLLQSKILLTEMRWNKLMTCLRPLTPLLHSYGEESSLLGKFILGMFSDSSVVNVTGALGKELENVKGSLRIMFHKDLRLRKMGLSSMMRSLMCEESSSKKLPQLTSPGICQLNDLFLVTCNFRERWNYYNYNIYKESDLKKTLKNFASLDQETRISSSSQMSTMLCDPSLHKIFLSCNGLELILKELHEGLLQQKNLEIRLISDLLKCLLGVVLLNPDACERLSRDVSLYSTLLRYAIVFSIRNVAESRVDATAIVFLLLFQRSARLIVSWHTNEPPFLDESTIRIPAAISARYYTPFENQGNYCESSPWATSSLCESLKCDERTARRMSERMRVVWNVSLCDGDVRRACSGGEDGIKKLRFNAALDMSDEDKELLQSTVPSCSISSAFSELEGARSHFSASRAVLRISTFLSFDETDERLLPTGWTRVLEKFISVAPSSPSDFLFLKDIVALLELIVIKSMSSTDASSSSYDWMAQCLPNESVLAAFSGSCEDQMRRGLPREILQLMKHLLASSRVDDSRQDGPKSLLDVLLSQMSQVEAMNSWQLSFLQHLLMVLSHVTARSGWSICEANLCNKVLQVLLKTCVSFHEGRSGVDRSYVGRGVTRFAALCLNHVAFEMANNHHSEEWAEQWHYASHLTSSEFMDSGLEWLFTLITYRDVEVCISGLSIATTLSSCEAGWRMLIRHVSSSRFQNIWDAALHILIDESECHFVRKQAASLVLNLMTRLATDESSRLQSLFVHDRENDVKLVGLPCLTYLLRETKFYEMFALMLNSFTLNGRQDLRVTRADDRVAKNETLISDITEEIDADRGGALRQSWTSPILLASLFDLLLNMLVMVPTETLQDIHQHRLVKAILRVFSSSISSFQENLTLLRVESSKFILLDLLDFLSSLVDFLCHLTTVDERTSGEEVLKDVVFLKYLPLSSVFFKASADYGDDVKLKSMKLMSSCFSLLTILLNSNIGSSFQIISKVYDDGWPFLKETLLKIVSDPSIFGSDVWFSGLQFITLFANKESLLMQTCQTSEDVVHSFIFNKHLNRKDENDAREFGESMVGMIKMFNFKSSELLQHKMLILESFKALAFISSPFRLRAFQAGILNIFMDHLQRTLLTLNTDFDSVLEKSAHKKAKPILKELQKTIEALQSLMTQSPEAKMSACRRDLAGIVASLWKCCLSSGSLMSSVLSMLTCFTAHSSDAISSLVATNINKQQGPTCSMFVCLLKFTQKEFSSSRKGNTLLLKAFQLLGNLITNSGCRSLLAKSTFLTETAGLIKSRNKKQISQTTEEILWLKFLAGLSFFGDGQLMILKIEDILSILLDQGASNFTKASCQLSVLTIRNLCFHPNNRAKLLSNDKVVAFLLKCLNEKSDHLASITCSAILVLLTCSQKLKVHLKNNATVMKRLQDLLEKQSSKPEVSGKWSLRQALRDIITIIDG